MIIEFLLTVSGGCAEPELAYLLRSRLIALCSTFIINALFVSRAFYHSDNRIKDIDRPDVLTSKIFPVIVCCVYRI